jgi:nucleotide-binding universal stress UspA family protein
MAHERDRILIGYDGKPDSRDAVALGAQLAETAAADLVVGTVVEHMTLPGDRATYEDVLAARTDPLFFQAGHELSEMNLRAVYRAVGGEDPGPGLGALAFEENADLIVIGSTSKGPVGRLLPGTTADALIRGNAAFAVAPRGYADDADRDLRLIGVAYDGSDGAKRAAQVAVGLAETAYAGLRIFGVREPLTSALAPGVAVPPAIDLHEHLENEIDELIDSLPTRVGGQKIILDGDPAPVLIGQGRFAADAMVFGCHGFGRILRLLAGSVTSTIVRGAPWPVIVVPEHGRLPFVVADDGVSAQVEDVPQ